MQTLLRSVFRADPGDDLNLLTGNAQELKQSRFQFPEPSQATIWDFIERFLTDHNHVPDWSSLELHFSQTDRNPDVLNQLQIIRSLSPIFRGDFKKRLTDKVEARRTKDTEELYRFANQINRTGAEIVDDRGRKTYLYGYRDSLNYVTSQGLSLCRPTTGIRKEGEVTSDTQEFWEDYERRRDDPNYGRGQLCGIQQIDEAVGGARRDQLWTHAAFTGELKSTFAFNWVYNQAVYFGFSSLFFSLEMPYDQCQRIIYTMHSLHEDFNEVRMELGIQDHPHIPKPLNYKYIRDGKLDPQQERFLKEYILPDLEEGGESGRYGQMHFRGYDPDSDYFRVSDIRAKGETLYRENPFDLLIVDHVLLVDPKKNHRSTTESANEVVRDLKKLSEVFMSGEGMALLALFQISREGKKRADKANGRYSKYDLSYSNEIERSSDIITASYLNNELVKRCRALFQFLKARDDGAPDPFYTRIDWPTRRLFTCFEKPGDEDVEALAEEVDEMSAEELLSSI